MSEAILADVRKAELKKACAAVMLCSKCFTKFVSHEPLAEPQVCEKCQ